MAIEKKIHYCWFGKADKTDIMMRCINSWSVKLPDYEIIEWNEENFDINICKYVSEAYHEKKYAFVSDYARFYVLYKYGGIYMDTDVEVLKSLDLFLTNKAFAGFETETQVNPGLILGAEKGNEFIKEMLDGYIDRKFIEDDGTYNLTTVVKYTTDTLLKYGLVPNNTLQNINGMVIYPKTFFCPTASNTNKTCFSDDTHTIHHFAASWHSDYQRKRNKSTIWRLLVPILKTSKELIIRLFGEKNYQYVKKISRRYTK